MVAEEPSAITWPSSSRAAIEPNPADDFPSPLGFLIDAARDCVESLLTTSPDEASAQLDRWAASEIPLLWRLAIHGWVERQDKAASEKITWLRQQAWLLDYGLRQEIFRLLATTLPDVTSDIANAVVDAIVAGTDGDDYTRARAAHILTFIAVHSPDPAHAQDARAAITSGHPDLQQPEDIEIADKTDEAGADQTPTTADELHTILEADASSVRDLSSSTNRNRMSLTHISGRGMRRCCGRWFNGGQKTDSLSSMLWGPVVQVSRKLSFPGGRERI